MARIVLVHGAFNELWGPNELKARWLPALRDGLWHHGVEVADEDVAVCFYGDLFRGDPEEPDDAAVAFQRTRAGIADVVHQMGGAAALEALHQAAGDAVLDRTLDLLATLSTRPTLYDDVGARLDELVGDDGCVLVAHSLGSIMGYRALCAHPDWPVHTFVTLGSPLGSDLVFPTLEPAPVDGRGVWPGSVQRWVNVAAVGDQLASVPRLATCFGPGVEDHRVDNGHRAHDPEPYLNATVTGAAVAEALDRG